MFQTRSDLSNNHRLLRIAHINTRSLASPFNHRSVTFAFEFDILAISKSWLRATNDSGAFDVSDSFLCRDRSSGARGGGVAMYISNALPYSSINFVLSSANISIDVIGITIFLRNKRIAVFSATALASFRPVLSFFKSCLSYAACCTDAMIYMIST